MLPSKKKNKRDGLKIAAGLSQEEFRDMVERKMDAKQYERLYQQGILRRVKNPLIDYIRRTGFFPPAT